MQTHRTSSNMEHGFLTMATYIVHDKINNQPIGSGRDPPAHGIAPSRQKRSLHATAHEPLYKCHTRSSPSKATRQLATAYSVERGSEREGEDIREECKHCKRKPPSGAELTQPTRSPLTKPTCFGSLAFKLSSISPPTSIPGMRILLTNTSINNF